MKVGIRIEGNHIMRLASLTDKDLYTWSTKFIALSKKVKQLQTMIMGHPVALFYLWLGCDRNICLR